MNFFKTDNNYETTNTIDEITLPGTKLTYDETLISKLKKDHRKLMKMHSSCLSAYDKKDFEKLEKTLRQFKLKYTAHLLLENTRFYTYLKHYFKSDSKNTNLIKRFTDDMDKNGQLVFKFLDGSSKSNYQFDACFRKELRLIGTILKERFVAGERDMYFLYQPPTGST